MGDKVKSSARIAPAAHMSVYILLVSDHIKKNILE